MEKVIKEDCNSAEFQLGLMQILERMVISKKDRKSTANYVFVRDLLLQHTHTGGRTSAYLQCDYMGIDPDGYTFYK